MKKPKTQNPSRFCGHLIFLYLQAEIFATVPWQQYWFTALSKLLICTKCLSLHLPYVAKHYLKTATCLVLKMYPCRRQNLFPSFHLFVFLQTRILIRFNKTNFIYLHCIHSCICIWWCNQKFYQFLNHSFSCMYDWNFSKY